jgi:hypothetical protein
MGEDSQILTVSNKKINFESCVSDFDAIANDIKIFQNPFNAYTLSLAPELQKKIFKIIIAGIL